MIQQASAFPEHPSRLTQVTFRFQSLAARKRTLQDPTGWHPGTPEKTLGEAAKQTHSEKLLMQ